MDPLEDINLLAPPTQSQGQGRLSMDNETPLEVKKIRDAVDQFQCPMVEEFTINSFIRPSPLELRRETSEFEDKTLSGTPSKLNHRLNPEKGVLSLPRNNPSNELGAQNKDSRLFRRTVEIPNARKGQTLRRDLVIKTFMRSLKRCY